MQLKLKQKGTMYDPEIRYETMPQLPQGIYAQEEVAKILLRPLPDYGFLEDSLYHLSNRECGELLRSELEAAERWEHLEKLKEATGYRKGRKRLNDSPNGYKTSRPSSKMLIDAFVLDYRGAGDGGG